MLTAEEKKWLKRLQKVLDECPSDRIGFYTIGDAELTVYDRTNEASFDEGQDFCRAVRDNDAELGTLRFPSEVHSTSG